MSSSESQTALFGAPFTPVYVVQRRSKISLNIDFRAVPTDVQKGDKQQHAFHHNEQRDARRECEVHSA